MIRARGAFERALRRAGLRQRRRVFGIGLPRTGTVSLASALGSIGFRILHYPRDERTFAELRRGISRLSVLDDYDGITDIPAIPIYPELARIFPRSRFVLTVRDEDAWLDSVRAHWRRNPSWSTGEEVDHTFAYRRWTRRAALGVAEFDADALRAGRAEHHERVRHFFRDDPGRLLVLDICDGEGWERLCPFLDRAAPKQGFPWHHRAPAA